MKQQFPSNISSEELGRLPACRFQGRVEIIEDPDKIPAACEVLAQSGVIGFDTETRPSFKAGRTNKVALLQLSTDKVCYLFRLCKMKFDKPIIKLLENSAIIKIGADVKGDLNSLQKLRHFKPSGFIDLQTIVGQWGIEEKSVRKMSAVVTGERVSKAQRLSNWEASELTEAQKKYAATDAWICLKIYNKLMSTPMRTLCINTNTKRE